MKKELRIGNIVQVTYQGEGFETKNQITCVTGISITYDIKVGNCYIDDSNVSPVRLNEEILLRFGAVRNPWGVNVGELLFKCNSDCSKLTLQVGNGHRVEINYVHELQNLYYSLTKKEL